MLTNLAGIQIRAIRAKQNLTQQQLADLADIPRATLASVERDDANPSLAVVYKIANALGVRIDDLIVESHQRIQAIRKSNMPQSKSPNGSYHATILSPANAHHFTQLIFNLAANSRHEGKPHPPGSEEYIYVMEGEVTIEAAEEEMHLKKGDSARFGGNVLHVYKNPTKRATTCIVTILETCY